MLLVAYLRERSVRGRALARRERRLLGPMIRRSSNGAAADVLARVGTRRLARLARRAGMRRFVPVGSVWGASRITAVDQARFFFQIDRLMPPRPPPYGMRLLRSIVPAQRWGIGRLRLPQGWRLYFKGG
jgi:hypothetical protein